MSSYTLVIHGGAGNIHPKRMSEAQQSAHRAVLDAALSAGEKCLAAGASAVEAVVAAVAVLEDSPLFNAGKGAVFTAEGKQEMDAAVMDGRDRNAGAVACTHRLRNPVRAAQVVLERSPHVLLAGEAAEQFAIEQGAAEENADYFFDQHRWDQLQEIRGTTALHLDFAGDEGDAPQEGRHGADVPEHDKYGTVGAVACDREGHVAAATSTGGLTNKRPGRVGDTPLIGAGVYAEDATCAVSCTGQGEYFMRGLVAADVAARMRYAGQPLEQAANAAIHETLAELGGKGGIIAVDCKGHYTWPFNTTGMFRAVSREGGERRIHMFRAESD
jgi:L-asparaginase / beta-aspartyl-peptidase